MRRKAVDYQIRADDDPTKAHINYQCPCGCTAGVLYDRDRVFTEVGECCCGRKMWAGGEAEKHIQPHFEPDVEYVWDRGSVVLPWGEQIETTLAVPTSELSAADHAAARPAADTTAVGVLVPDVVCGMMIDPKTAAATSSYRGALYYFCAASCKTRFDANPGQFLPAGPSLLSRLLGR